MPFVDLVCLANSEKMRGRCIAGIRTDGSGWVRPVAPDTDHGQLYFSHYKLADGTEPKVLDLIAVDLAHAAPIAGQPENWVIGESEWRLKSRPAPPELCSNLGPAIAIGPSLLGSTRARIPALETSRLTSSLALVSPSKLRWYLKRDVYDRSQPRVRFELDGQPYDLPVTDPFWKSRIMRRLSEVEIGYYERDKIGVPKGSNVLLTVSLGEPFKGYCYKLVAAMVVTPEIAETR